MILLGCIENKVAHVLIHVSSDQKVFFSNSKIRKWDGWRVLTGRCCCSSVPTFRSRWGSFNRTLSRSFWCTRVTSPVTVPPRVIRDVTRVYQHPSAKDTTGSPMGWRKKRCLALTIRSFLAPLPIISYRDLSEVQTRGCAIGSCSIGDLCSSLGRLPRDSAGR